MSELYDILKPENTYYDRKNYDSQASYNQALATSSTVYVGNLSFFTSQDSIRELFSLAGRVVEIIMGINDEGTACGFCFVIYDTHEDAAVAVEYLSRTRLNDRVIRVDWDPGYLKGREKGRGSGGQQRREDFKEKEDDERPRKRPFNDGKGKEREYRGERDRGGYRGERDRGDRGDRGDRVDRGDRSDRGRGYYDRRGNRDDRGDRRDRGERGDRGDREDRRQREYRGERDRSRRQPQERVEKQQPKKQDQINY